MADTTTYFTVPSLKELASLDGWQLDGGIGTDARYRNVLLKFRLTCREHPTLLRGPVVNRFHLTENDSRTIRTSTRRTILKVEKVTDNFTRSVAEKLIESIASETQASGGLGAGRVTSKFSATLASELTDAWSSATTRESVVSREETVETQEEASAAGIADKMKTVTVHKMVKHLEYELRLVGYHAFAIATKKEGLVMRDLELQTFTHAVPVDARVATTHVYVAWGPEQLHTAIRRREGGTWVDESPPYPAYVPEIEDAPLVTTAIDATLASVVEHIFETDEEIRRALARALDKAKRHAGAARKHRQRESALPAPARPPALPPARVPKPRKPVRKPAGKAPVASASARRPRKPRRR